MNDPRILAANKLVETLKNNPKIADRFAECYCSLDRLHYDAGTCGFPKDHKFASDKLIGIGKADTYWNKAFSELSAIGDPDPFAVSKTERIGPWLRIEDGNPWSSSAILKRTGFDASEIPLWEWLLELPNAINVVGNVDADMAAIIAELTEGHQESANILAYCKLVEIDPELALKSLP